MTSSTDVDESGPPSKRPPARPPLGWFPFDPGAWRSHTELLTFEESGALLHIYGFAWKESNPPCTIGDAPTVFDRLLGSHRESLEKMVRSVFVPDPEHPGRLRSAWLTALYEEQLGRYSAKQRGGEASGKQRKGKELHSVRTEKEQRSGSVATKGERRLNTSEPRASFESKNKTPVGGASPKPPPDRGAPSGTAAGRGVATAAPSAPVERPTRYEHNEPHVPDEVSVADAEAWAAADPANAAAVARELALEVPDVTDPRSRQLLRTPALRRAYRAANPLPLTAGAAP